MPGGSLYPPSKSQVSKGSERLTVSVSALRWPWMPFESNACPPTR